MIEYGKEVKYGTHIECFNLESYPLKNSEVKSLVSSIPKDLDRETLGS